MTPLSAGYAPTGETGATSRSATLAAFCIRGGLRTSSSARSRTAPSRRAASTTFAARAIRSACRKMRASFYVIRIPNFGHEQVSKIVNFVGLIKGCIEADVCMNFKNYYSCCSSVKDLQESNTFAAPHCSHKLPIVHTVTFRQMCFSL